MYLLYHMICIYIRPDPSAKTVAKLRHKTKMLICAHIFSKVKKVLRIRSTFGVTRFILLNNYRHLHFFLYHMTITGITTMATDIRSEIIPMLNEASDFSGLTYP